MAEKPGTSRPPQGSWFSPLKWVDGFYKFALATALLAAATGGGLLLWKYNADQLRIARLEQEKRVLNEVIDRLSAERRVAEVIVTGVRREPPPPLSSPSNQREKPGQGVKVTTLLFVEYARDGKPLPPRTFEVRGEMIHIDAMVLRFERHFVKEGDGLRGHSIALFKRIYGDAQTPESGLTMDEPGEIPLQYRGASTAVSEFERKLWADFWELSRNETLRQQYGVRVAWGEGTWGPFEPGRIYTIALESAGGMTVSSQPMKPIYLEALKQSAGASLGEAGGGIGGGMGGGGK